MSFIACIYCNIAPFWKRDLYRAFTSGVIQVVHPTHIIGYHHWSSIHSLLRSTQRCIRCIEQRFIHHAINLRIGSRHQTIQLRELIRGETVWFLISEREKEISIVRKDVLVLFSKWKNRAEYCADGLSLLLILRFNWFYFLVWSLSRRRFIALLSVECKFGLCSNWRPPCRNYWTDRCVELVQGFWREVFLGKSGHMVIALAFGLFYARETFLLLCADICEAYKHDYKTQYWD